MCHWRWYLNSQKSRHVWSPSAWFEKCISSLFCSHICSYCHGGLLTEQGKSPPSIEKPLTQRLAFYFYNMYSLTPLGLEKSSREITRQINYFSQVCWLAFPVRYKLFGNREPINSTYSLLPSSTSGLLIYSISGVTCTNPPAVSSAGRSEGVLPQDGGSLNVELWGRKKEGVKGFQLWKRRANAEFQFGQNCTILMNFESYGKLTSLLLG